MKPISEINRAASFVEHLGAYYSDNRGLSSTGDRKVQILEWEEHLLALPWITQRTARHECFMSLEPRNYTYGKGRGEQTYTSIPMTDKIRWCMQDCNALFGANFNVCFLNKYDDQHQHLHWHADDFPGMDPEEPIVVVSFGAEREIWLKDNRGVPVDCPQCGGSGWDNSERRARCGDPPFPCDRCDASGKVFGKGEVPDSQRVLLREGSLFVMPPGYQATHQHRIPKHDRPCGWRISLTFRTFKS